MNESGRRKMQIKEKDALEFISERFFVVSIMLTSPMGQCHKKLL
jgi:hypothetical protein